MSGTTDVSPRDHLSKIEKVLWPGLWTGLFLGTLALSLGACDGVPGVGPGEDGPDEGSPDSLRIDLLESGQVVRGFEGSGPLRPRGMRPLEGWGGRKSGGGKLTGDYACTISLYRPEGPRGPGYYYRSAEMTYPDSVLEKADGEMARLQARIRLTEVPHESKINALLRCRLPAVEGAERWVRRFFRVGPEQLRASGFTGSDSTASRAGKTLGSRGSTARKGLDCDDVEVCWRGDCAVNDGGTSCSGGGGGFGGGVGGLPSSGGTDYPQRMIQPFRIDGGSGYGGPEPGDNQNPCESDNPPDYCDEAGSCYDRNIANENDRKIIRGLEENGELDELWEKSNPNASDQSKREERGGWIVSTDDGYKLVEFHEAESDITYTPLGIKGIDSENRPSGTVGSLHLQPFEENEVITSVEVLRMAGASNPEQAAEKGIGAYSAGPSESDYEDAEHWRGYVADKNQLYGYSWTDTDGDGVVDESEKNSNEYTRCGY